MKFEEDGTYTPGWRMPEETKLHVYEMENGDNGDLKALAGWTVKSSEEEGYLHTLWNPEYEERNGISTVSSNGALGTAILPGTVLRYELCCVNTGTSEKNIRMNVLLDAQEEWMPANSDERFRRNGALLTAEISALQPGEEERLILAAAVIPEAKGMISCKAAIDGQEFKEIHPIGASGTVTLFHRVTGTAASEVDREFVYQLFFFDKDGNELKGAVSYQKISTDSGAFSETDIENGVVRSGELFTLEKGDMATFSGLPWGTICRAEEARESRQDSELEFSALSARQAEAETGKKPASICFSYEKRDGTRRDLFQKKKEYILKEQTGYSDGTVLLTGVQSFSLDEEGIVNRMDVPNEKAEVQIEKVDQETGERVEGAVLQLFLKTEKETEDGTVNKAAEKTAEENELLLEEWKSEAGRPYLIQELLSPGEKLVLREEKAPDGYGMAKEVEFTVPEEGGLLSVRMEDRPVHVKIYKLALDRDGVTELGPLAGAVIRIEEENGREVYRFETGTDGVTELPPILEAGRTYLAVEESAPVGYEISEPVSFTVPEEGGAVSVVIYDRKKKRPGNSGGGSEEFKQPKTPEPVEGTITVHYNEFVSGSGSVHLPYKRLSPLPSTGEGGDGFTGENSGGLFGKGSKEGIWLLSGFAAAVFLFMTAAALFKERKKRKMQEK